MIGSIVGSYRVLDLVSAGGMGTVYRAEHTLLGRIAAVKVLHPEMCANKDVVNRFFNEAKATTAIKHPGIVEIFDFGYMPSGHAYLVMEFLEGMPLSSRIRQRPRVDEGEAAMILRGVCSALAAAHAKGIVHRDLKPDNIFVIPDADSPLGERFKLLDFGIAKLTDIGMAASTTKTGAVMGTPTYMSPEQCKGTGDVDHRADLYSIGCIFYQLVTGRPPFIQLGAGELIGSHLFMKPESPAMHVANLSPQTEAIIMRLLEKEPANRIQTARELASHLGYIAQSGGWNPVADPSVSKQMAAASEPTRAMGMSTGPLFTPVQPLTPYFPTPMPNTGEQQPTTLSSALGQQPSVAPPAPRRSRASLVIGLALGASAIAGVIAFTALRGGSSDRAAATMPTAANVPALVAPTPAAPVEPVVAPPEVKPSEATPTEVKPTEVKPTEATPTEVKPDVVATPEAKPDVVATPEVAKKPDAKPAAKPAKQKPVAVTPKPTPKPTVKPKPATPTTPGLIEDDL